MVGPTMQRKIHKKNNIQHIRYRHYEWLSLWSSVSLSGYCVGKIIRIPSHTHHVPPLTPSAGNLPATEGGHTTRRFSCSAWEYCDPTVAFGNGHAEPQKKTWIEKYIFFRSYFCKKEELGSDLLDGFSPLLLAMSRLVAVVAACRAMTSCQEDHPPKLW